MKRTLSKKAACKGGFLSIQLTLIEHNIPWLHHLRGPQRDPARFGLKPSPFPARNYENPP